MHSEYRTVAQMTIQMVIWDKYNFDVPQKSDTPLPAQKLHFILKNKRYQNILK